MKKVDTDLEICKKLYKEKYYDYPRYLAQQSVEEYLKAFLIENNIDYPKTLDIKQLIKICKDINKDFEYLYKIYVDKLTIYSTETRYQEYDFIFNEEDARNDRYC
ncbi:HEPN domain-containing protein [Nanobdella aerobiophila]|uniref:HEPN domain-containing protein n=1 Tax=Nanobdella aerobiophila TaxID=2586965 RepID=UPI0035C0D515